MTDQTQNRDNYHKYKDKDLAIDALLGYLKGLTYHLHKQGIIDLIELRKICFSQSIAQQKKSTEYEPEDPCPLCLMYIFLTQLAEEDGLIDPPNVDWLLKPEEK